VHELQICDMINAVCICGNTMIDDVSGNLKCLAWNMAVDITCVEESSITIKQTPHIWDPTPDRGQFS